VSSSASPRDRWAAVADLFARALEQPPLTREAFIRGAAAADDALAADVLSLLSAHERADGFMEKPAAVTAIEGRAEVASVLAPGQLVGHYRITGMLGEGGMGIVYLADDTRLGRRIALKAVAPGPVGDDMRTARLRREARAVAALSHPNIATIYALEEIDGQLYIASEYVPGRTLRAALGEGPVPPHVVRDTAIAVASALGTAHARGIVHRDLKPENIMQTPDGGVKILDFGLAQFHESTGDSANFTGGEDVIGTPAYMSPEQIRGSSLDGRSDLFALGVMMYELVARIHPFAATTSVGTLARILQDEPPSLAAVVPAGISSSPGFAEVEATIGRCLPKSPDERVQTAAEVVGLLNGRLVAPAAAATPTLESARLRPGPTGAVPVQDRRAMLWWQFHQGAAMICYLLLVIPLWGLRHANAMKGLGMWLLLVAVAAMVVASGLRWHTWFAAREYPDQWRSQHRRARGWIRGADLVFAATLLAAGGLLASTADNLSGLLVASAFAIGVSNLVIEPATTKAAFKP